MMMACGDDLNLEEKKNRILTCELKDSFKFELVCACYWLIFVIDGIGEQK